MCVSKTGSTKYSVHSEISASATESHSIRRPPPPLFFLSLSLTLTPPSLSPSPCQACLPPYQTRTTLIIVLLPNSNSTLNMIFVCGSKRGRNSAVCLYSLIHCIFLQAGFTIGSDHKDYWLPVIYIIFFSF